MTLISTAPDTAASTAGLGTRGLSPASARAVDAFFAARLHGADALRGDHGLAARLDRVASLTALLERDAAAAEPVASDAAASRALRSVAAARLAARVAPARVSADDGAALDAWLEARARGSDAGPRPAGSAERTAAVAGWVGLLEADVPDDASLGDEALVSATLDRCREARQQRRFQNQVAMLAHGRAGGSTPWRQVMAAAGVVLLALSVLLPALQHNRAFAHRVACASNLGVAGQGLAAYAADFGGLMPRAPMAEDARWWDVGADAPDGRVRSNSAHLYLLIRRNYVSPDDLVCPENEHADQVPLTAQRHDWASPEQVSFSFHNVSGRSIRLVRTPDLAVLADKNPLFVAKAGRVSFDPDADPDAPSRAHASSGQNVLRADGVVVWTIRPVLEKHDLFDDDDNIWVASGVRTYDGDEQPATDDDSFLVP